MSHMVTCIDWPIVNAVLSFIICVTYWVKGNWSGYTMRVFSYNWGNKFATDMVMVCDIHINVGMAREEMCTATPCRRGPSSTRITALAGHSNFINSLFSYTIASNTNLVVAISLSVLGQITWSWARSGAPVMRSPDAVTCVYLNVASDRLPPE